MDNRLGWSFLREDAYELVFTSDNPVVAWFRLKTERQASWHQSIWLMKMLSISPRRGQISVVRYGSFCWGYYKPASRQKIIVVGMISGKTDWKLKSYGKHCSH